MCRCPPEHVFPMVIQRPCVAAQSPVKHDKTRAVVHYSCHSFQQKTKHRSQRPAFDDASQTIFREVRGTTSGQIPNDEVFILFLPAVSIIGSRCKLVSNGASPGNKQDLVPAVCITKRVRSRQVVVIVRPGSALEQHCILTSCG